MKRKTMLILALLLAATSMTLAQKAENVYKDEVLRLCSQAMFGRQSLESIKSISVESYFHGSEIPNHVLVKRPSKFRNGADSDGAVVFDGHRAAWTRRSADEQGNAREPELIEESSWKHFEVDIALVFPAIFDYPCTLSGVTDLPGGPAWKLEVKLPLGGYMVYCVDTKTHLITERHACWDGNPDDVWVTRVLEHKSYDGCRLPVLIEFNGRHGLEQARYDNYRINVPAPDSLFAIPAGL